MDGEIEAAPTWSIEKQEQLFFRFARHLFDNQVRDRVDERADSSNNDAWLAALAEWLGWDSERREAVINRAAEAAMVVLPDETFDPTERG